MKQCRRKKSGKSAELKKPLQWVEALRLNACSNTRRCPLSLEFLSMGGQMKVSEVGNWVCYNAVVRKTKIWRPGSCSWEGSRPAGQRDWPVWFGGCTVDSGVLLVCLKVSITCARGWLFSFLSGLQMMPTSCISQPCCQCRCCLRCFAGNPFFHYLHSFPTAPLTFPPV